MSLATSSGDSTWSASCFYAADFSNMHLIFTSELHTRHAKECLENNKISGTIALETRITGKIRGIQFTGKVFLLEKQELDNAKTLYYKRFPVARLFNQPFWKIELDMIKMTDNRLGFGTKLFWYRQS